MDLKVYYQKLRETEASLPGRDVVVISLTADGPAFRPRCRAKSQRR